VITMKNALYLLLAASLAGCGMLEAEAETKRLCVEQRNAAVIPAACDPTGPGGCGPISVPFTPAVELVLGMGDAVPDLDEEGIEADINPEAITVGSVAGTVNFSGVETVTLTIQPPADRPDLAPAVFRYERAGAQPAAIFELPARPVTAVDLADYIVGNVLRIGISFSGAPPQEPWNATLEMCGDTRVNVDYWERITG
jgi:hypothetical protein